MRTHKLLITTPVNLNISTIVVILPLHTAVLLFCFYFSFSLFDIPLLLIFLEACCKQIVNENTLVTYLVGMLPTSMILKC